MAIGAFAPVDYVALRSRMIIRAPAPKAPVGPTPPPSRVPVPTSRLPLTPKTVPPPNVDPIVQGGTILTETVPNMGGGGSAPPTGGTSGTVTNPGSTGGSSDTNALLLNALGNLFKSQDVGQSMAPVSFAPTDGGSATTTDGGGGSKVGALIFLGVLVAGGAYWYTHK